MEKPLLKIRIEEPAEDKKYLYLLCGFFMGLVPYAITLSYPLAVLFAFKVILYLYLIKAITWI